MKIMLVLFVTLCCYASKQIHKPRVTAPSGPVSLPVLLEYVCFGNATYCLDRSNALDLTIFITENSLNPKFFVKIPLYHSEILADGGLGHQ